MNKRPRSSAEVARSQQQLRDHTEREIDEIYPTYMTPGSAIAALSIAAIYSRYSTRYQDSIVDQVRVLLAFAKANDLHVPREHIYFDLAARGAKRNRFGLERAETCLRAKRAGTLLLFSTSRLFRKTYHTLNFVDRIHKGLNIRCVFVKSGVDTNDKLRWEQMLAVMAMLDQFVAQVNVGHIHAAHEGLLAKQFVFGTLSFGYAGDPIPGEFTKLNRPRCRIVIDPIAAQIVRDIYEWFARLRMSIATIVQKLNSDSSIPLPPCARSQRWTKNAVKNLLRNTRYRGLWRYGVMETVYDPDADYFRQRQRVEPLAQVELEDLRIVTDDLWYAAQARLVEQQNTSGRRASGKHSEQQPRLLNGLLFCCGHEAPQRLYVAGTNGRAMECPICRGLPPEQRNLYSDIDRVHATRMICEKIQLLICSDETLLRQVVDRCQELARSAEAPSPGRIGHVRKAVAQLDRTIEFTRRHVGESAEDQAAAQATIRQAQADLAALRVEMQVLDCMAKRQARIPTEKEVLELLQSLGDRLAVAATSDDPELLGLAREVIRSMTGGMIKVEQAGERRRHHGWAIAKLEVDVLSYVVQTVSGVPCDSAPGEVLVDLRRPRKSNPKENEAYDLEKQGFLQVEIAEKLGCTESNVTHLLRKAKQKRGEQYETGHARRAKMKRRQRVPTKSEKFAEQVQQLRQQKVSKQEIASRLEISEDTVSKICRQHVSTNGGNLKTDSD